MKHINRELIVSPFTEIHQEIPGVALFDYRADIRGNGDLNMVNQLDSSAQEEHFHVSRHYEKINNEDRWGKFYRQWKRAAGK